MKQKDIIAVFDLDSIDAAAANLINTFPEARIFAFYGDMGSGKTTFIKSVCRSMGVGQFVTSPTFALVNEYRDIGGKLSFFHFDFYRIEKVDEVLDMGYEDYFYSESFCFIEWPEKVAALLPDNTLKISIDVLDNGNRQIRKL